MEVGLPCGLRHVDGPQLGPFACVRTRLQAGRSLHRPGTPAVAAKRQRPTVFQPSQSLLPLFRLCVLPLLPCSVAGLAVWPPAACHPCCPMLSTCRSAHDMECVAALPAGGGQVRGAFFHAVHARQADQPAAGGERELQAANTAVGVLLHLMEPQLVDAAAPLLLAAKWLHCALMWLAAGALAAADTSRRCCAGGARC